MGRQRRSGAGNNATPRRADRWWMRVLGWAVGGAWLLGLAAIALAPPRPAPGPTVFYDRYGNPVGSLGGAYRPAQLSELPYALRAATLAAEDTAFPFHHGFHPLALVRAAWRNLRAGAVVEGGSTITQQLAKNLYLSPARTWARKWQEALLTLRLEAHYSKDAILALYLNNVNYGEGARGVGAAAETYFARGVSTLDLAQSALLAGIPSAPQTYDPFLHPAAALARRRWVLERMVADGFIGRDAARAAQAEPLGLRRGANATDGGVGYFLNYALTTIGARDPALLAALRVGGYRVYTTLDAVAEAAAVAAIAKDLPAGRSDRSGVVQPQVALVAIDPRDGAVRALVGGRTFALSPYNRAIQARRQPASTFKPILYATVLGAGHTVTERQFDGPVTYREAGGRRYTVRDVGPYLMRWLTMREALAVSNNVVAVKWAALVGPARVVQTARTMGVTSPLQPTLPMVLGAEGVTPLEIVDAYVPLANLGTAFPPWAVRRVVAPNGVNVWPAAPPTGRPALRPGVAYIVTSLLQSVMTEGTGRSLQGIVGRPVAGKSGTSDGARDAWFVGYTPQLVAGVWVGDDHPAPLDGSGASLAGPVWAHFMASALAGTTPSAWAAPPDVVALDVSATDGLLPNPSSPRVTELFLRGTQPLTISPVAPGSEGAAGIVGLPGSDIIPPHLGTLPALPGDTIGAGLPWAGPADAADAQ